MSKTPRDKRFLFDLNHPADFHFFKNLFSYLGERGYSFRVLARDKECLHELLEAQGIPYVSRGKGSHFLPGKYVYAVYILLLSFIQLLLFRPGLTLSLSSPYLITVSRFLRIPTLVYDDTDFNPRLLPLIKRADYIFTPANYPHTFHKNHFHIHTYKELAYLTPSLSGMEEEGDAVFFRLTRTDSVHHGSEARIGGVKLIHEINRISNNHTCFLSSETGIFDNLTDKVLFPDRVNVHRDLKECCAFWGNSATMAAEAVILGIPSVFVGSEKFAYLKELEDHGLLYCFQPDELELSFRKLDELISWPQSKKHFEQARIQLLKEKINITGLLIWFVENQAEGALSLRENPAIQFRFRSPPG